MNDLMQRLRQSRQLQVLGLIAPALLWLVLFFAVPLVIVFVYSFLTRGTYGQVIWDFNLGNYVRVFDSLYVRIFLRSLRVAALTTMLCLAVGYPLGYFIARRGPRRRGILLLLLVVPFWTNFLVRTYAWRVILSNEGPINSLLMGLGLTNRPVPMLFTEFAVLVGLVYSYLPEMVLPIYAAVERLDFNLVQAAHDLYANDFQAFRRVVLPLTMPGILAGSILVFIPCLGAFVTPDILGGARTVMLGNLIQQQFLTARDWPFGSAVSFVLMAVMLVGTLIYFRQGGRTL
ncbi:MAG: ABC transporter permease [Anaerolineae bacterium]|uniref:ABC transporter permease n=1 Tax=Candidatus Amarolinea dominans TaxID=3140696 RepID=UPI0031376496|nr:ABC transporter permease [Anaerolineae bacterium]MBK9091705.1 ABC transporter permease [Anaerolineae bacterium]MBK9233539.1 ABC transporter permease [Anaerolineae bacterium]